MTYHCPNCGNEISFGESICPSCKANVTDVWEQNVAPKPQKPKVVPGMGTNAGDQNAGSPFPPPGNQNAGSPFPPPGNQNAGSPFPPPVNLNAGSPFPPPAKNGADSAFPAASQPNEPFPPAQPASSPFPPAPESQAFPSASATPQAASVAHLEIPRIGAHINIPASTPAFRIGRDDIQGAATQALPDLNAYKNISRKRENSEHFIIHHQNGEFSIEDIHSTNGTYLGTTKLGPGIPPQQLRDGDKIIVPIEEFGKMVQLEIIFHKQ